MGGSPEPHWASPKQLHRAQLRPSWPSLRSVELFLLLASLLPCLLRRDSWMSGLVASLLDLPSIRHVLEAGLRAKLERANFVGLAWLRQADFLKI